MKLNLNKYNPKTGLFVVFDDEYSLDQLTVIMKILEKLNNLPNLTKYNQLVDEGNPLAKEYKISAKAEQDIKKIFFNPKLSKDQLNLFLFDLDSPLTTSQLKIVFNASFSLPQMNMLSSGFKMGLAEEEVSVFANAKFDINQMKFLRNQLVNGVDLEVVKAVADPTKSVGIMEQLVESILGETELLSPEGRKAAIDAMMKNIYLDSLIDLNVEISTDDNQSPVFKLDGRAIDEQKLVQLISKGGEPDVISQKIKYAFDEEIAEGVLALVDSAIDADLGEHAIAAIAGSKDIVMAQSIYKDMMNSVTGEEVTFEREAATPGIYKINFGKKTR